MRGAVYDVLIDLRPDSPTFRRWYGAELTEENGAALYIPAGFAHGFQTLCDDAAISYLLGARYSPGHERGVRWNDRAFGISWPISDPILNERDASYPDFG
jgi:dTDP-4-dehydrorhamnose 3,5-epimerase